MSSLGKFKILIADSDPHLSDVTRFMLKGMGFRNIQVTSNGATAYELIKRGTFDFVITEWALKEMNGLSLIQHIRRAPDSPNPTLPVIMLTGRMEQSDVQAARDYGIHEYVIKPFSAKNIYHRLERIVEYPRYFVVGGDFVGPDRRNRHANRPGADRRVTPLVPERKPWNAVETIHTRKKPTLWLPDFSLKHKLGGDMKLEALITPALLNQVQAGVDASSETSMQWVKKDLEYLHSLFALIKQSAQPEGIIEEATEVALLISSRSGTFGYARASQVAYQLYLFMRRHFRLTASHLQAAEKHMEVLNFIFSRSIRAEEGEILQVIQELKNLTDKYGYEVLQ